MGTQLEVTGERRHATYMMLIPAQFINMTDNLEGERRVYEWVDGSMDPRVDSVALEFAVGGSNNKVGSVITLLGWPSIPQNIEWGCRIVANIIFFH